MDVMPLESGGGGMHGGCGIILVSLLVFHRRAESRGRCLVGIPDGWRSHPDPRTGVQKVFVL